ncbi:Flp pilus assembly complex ATPase component TadA|uniref:Type II secretion system protein E (GspE) n=1 Tax=Dendrosporobacter quercicolus TaxID=146817 RepID=A0A1G9M815_9FIRM|nr:GspE/PulE family protein [Dendrosporobacter quercicolus]NSL46956.1 Flp pilus assembly complex ATPase component TadA [Dendrosporobacter quercicolus DSM 1736]SDL70442.1 type II secretion system protein E (GspE) [Dendrosporobacter quercicolus]
MENGRKRLGDLLLEVGLITEEQLENALQVQKQSKERLGEIILSLGYVSEENMIEVLEFQLGVPRIELKEESINKAAALTIPVQMAEKYKVIPVSKEGRKLTLAMVDPTNFYAIDDVRLLAGCEVVPMIAREKDVLRAISKVYGVTDLVEKAVTRLQPEETLAVEQMQATEDAPMIGIVNSLFSQAVRERASDIHIEPQETTLRVRFRIDGLLREFSSFPINIHAALVSRVKIMGHMDISERRVPQDGRIQIQEAGRAIDIRVSTLPTIYGEKIVMRILDKQAVMLDIGRLGFSAGNLDKYRRLFTQSYGMILITGPTGSGKTTTLYSTLGELSTPAKNVITIEDPVEYRLEGINQVQVNPKTGMTFAGGLRAVLRQDPNIVMVGEIRDGETADIAIRAALTGHLVLSTLHTNDAPGAVSRLLDMDVEPFLVASSVLGVIAQRLVRVICPKCKQSYAPAPDSPERSFLGLAETQEVALYRGAGCPECGSSGYKGRMSVHEVMPVSSAVRELITQRRSADEIREAAVREGMLCMREDGIAKALAGRTTVAEVMRVAYVTL